MFFPPYNRGSFCSRELVHVSSVLTSILQPTRTRRTHTAHMTGIITLTDTTCVRLTVCTTSPLTDALGYAAHKSCNSLIMLSHEKLKPNLCSKLTVRLKEIKGEVHIIGNLFSACIETQQHIHLLLYTSCLPLQMCIA